MRAAIYVEGAGRTKGQQAELRRAFSKLFAKCGLTGRMPKITACGGRDDAFKDFKKALAGRESGFVALLVDSEAPVENLEDPWGHLWKTGIGPRPEGVSDDQALLMVTCMESWVAADPACLPPGSDPEKLPRAERLEQLPPRKLMEALTVATRGRYSKGTVSFRCLALADPLILEAALPSFRRVVRILRARA